jgi:acyl carrier protein
MHEATVRKDIDFPPNDSLESEITFLVAGITELDSTEIWVKRDAHFFKDMEIDSLLALEILACLEKKYRIEVPEERLPEITTLNNIIELVRSLQ